MTTLWEKIKAELVSLEQGAYTSLVHFEGALKSLFESHAAEVAQQHIGADEQVSAAVAAANVLTLDPSPVAEVPAVVVAPAGVEIAPVPAPVDAPAAIPAA